MNTLRLKKLQSVIASPILIKKKENLHYLTGQIFDAKTEEYLLVTKKNAVAFGGGLDYINWFPKVDEINHIAKYLPKKSYVAVEYGFTYAEGKYLKHFFKEKGITFKPEKSPVDILRQIKDQEEIRLIGQSMQIVEKVFGEVKRLLKKKSWTEAALATFIQKRGIDFGAEAISFPAIVASGSNAAIPHHVPGTKKLVTGESIVIDFGFKYKGYCSDFTRTVFLKKVPEKLAQAYRQTEEAYRSSMDTACAGISAAVPHNRAVAVLAEKKLEKYFIHTLGHGTGLEIHEGPYLYTKSKDILQNGMVFSIEPGVYFPKVGGIRIEDLVYLEKGKVKKFITIATALSNNII